MSDDETYTAVVPDAETTDSVTAAAFTLFKEVQRLTALSVRSNRSDLEATLIRRECALDVTAAAMQSLANTYKGIPGATKDNMNKSKALCKYADAWHAFPDFTSSGDHLRVQDAARKFRNDLSVIEIEQLTAKLNQEAAKARANIEANRQRTTASGEIGHADPDLSKAMNTIKLLMGEALEREEKDKVDYQAEPTGDREASAQNAEAEFGISVLPAPRPRRSRPTAM